MEENIDLKKKNHNIVWRAFFPQGTTICSKKELHILILKVSRETWYLHKKFQRQASLSPKPLHYIYFGVH